MENESAEMKKKTITESTGKKKKKAKYIVFPLLLLLALGGCCVGYYYYTRSSNYFTTDNAKVTARMYNVVALSSGKLLAWDVEVGDFVENEQVLGRQEVLPYITAPISGTVVKNDGAVNQMAAAGSPLAVIADTQNLYIGVNIEETDIHKISVGQTVDISIDAYPKRTFSGQVTEINQTTQTYFSGAASFSTSGTYTKITQLIPIKVAIQNTDNLPLVFGMNATVKIHIGSNGAKELTQVSIAAVKPSADLEGLTWSGSIEALRSVEIASNAGGKVVDIRVSEGQNIQTGDILFTLDNADQQLQLKQAQAGYHAAQVAAASAATIYNNNTLAEPAQLAKNDAEENYQRLKTLYDANALSEAELNLALSRLESAQAQLKAAQINQKNNYDNTQSQLGTAQAAVEIAEKRLMDCTITAPSDGLAAKINVEIGAFVSQQTPCITLIDNSALQVKIQVMETAIEQIKPKMDMSIYIPSTGESYGGSIGEIVPLGNSKTGMFEVSVLLQNTASLPRLGLTADVRIAASASASTVYVPEASIISENGQSWVFLVVNGSAKKQEVIIFNRKNAYVEVGGLSVGDEVVLNSSTQLTDGQIVNVISWIQ